MRPLTGNRFRCFRFRCHFDLNFQGMTSFSQGRFDSIPNVACCADVIILYQNSIAQIHAVIVSTALLDGIFFEKSESGRRFPGISHRASGVFTGIHNSSGRGRDARQALKKIQGEPFTCKNPCAEGTRDRSEFGHVTQDEPVSQEHLVADGWIDPWRTQVRQRVHW